MECLNFNNSIGVVLGKGLNGKINLWTLDDIACLRVGGVGVQASWTLMLSIDANVPYSICTCFKNGDLLLMFDHVKWFSYNSDKKEAKEVPVPVYQGNICKYTETLVSVTGFKQVKWNAHQAVFCHCSIG